MADSIPVLCVDDEAGVLRVLAWQLRAQYEVHTESSAAAALAWLEQNGPVAAVLCDINMPGMSGTEALATMAERWPTMVRMIYTGQDDLQVAIDAIHRARVFRFLLKPTPRPTLLAALEDAIEQHRLLTAERELLQKTLRGAVAALIETLALVSPQEFGQATQLRRRVMAAGKAAGFEDTWDLEVAAMLSFLGAVVVPGEIARRKREGLPLDQGDVETLASVPETLDRVLAPIPRLEGVRAILRAAISSNASSPNAGDLLSPLQAQKAAVLRAALAGAGDSNEAGAPKFLTLKLRQLRPGLRPIRDIRTATDVLLVPAGQALTVLSIQRVVNFARRLGVPEPIEVIEDAAEDPPDGRPV